MKRILAFVVTAAIGLAGGYALANGQSSDRQQAQAWAEAEGIFQPDPDKTAEEYWTEPVSRSDMAVYLWRMDGAPPQATTSTTTAAVPITNPPTAGAAGRPVPQPPTTTTVPLTTVPPTAATTSTVPAATLPPPAEPPLTVHVRYLGTGELEGWAEASKWHIWLSGRAFSGQELITLDFRPAYAAGANFSRSTFGTVWTRFPLTMPDSINLTSESWRAVTCRPAPCRVVIEEAADTTTTTTSTTTASTTTTTTAPTTSTTEPLGGWEPDLIIWPEAGGRSAHGWELGLTNLHPAVSAFTASVTLRCPSSGCTYDGITNEDPQTVSYSHPGGPGPAALFDVSSGVGDLGSEDLSADDDCEYTVNGGLAQRCTVRFVDER